jgi:hypothetical protein
MNWKYISLHLGYKVLSLPWIEAFRISVRDHDTPSLNQPNVAGEGCVTVGCLLPFPGRSIDMKKEANLHFL